MVRARTVVPLAVGVVALAAIGLTLPPLWLIVDESAMPPASVLPTLPDGARVVGQDMGCGSGGCWRELTVEAPAGMSGEELAARVLPDGSASAFQGVLDLRRVTSAVMDVEAGSARFAVQYDRLVD